MDVDVVDQVNQSSERIPVCRIAVVEVEVEFDGRTRIEESGGMWGGGMIRAR